MSTETTIYKFDINIQNYSLTSINSTSYSMEFISKHHVTKIKHCKANLCPWFMAYRDSSWPTKSEDGEVSHFTEVLPSALLPIPTVTPWDVTPSPLYYR